MLGLSPSSLAEPHHCHYTLGITTTSAEPRGHPSGGVGQEQDSSKGLAPPCSPASLGWTPEGWRSKTAFGWETKSLQPMESSLKT